MEHQLDRNKYELIFISTCTNTCNIEKLVRSIILSNNSLRCLLIIVAQDNIIINFEQTQYSSVSLICIENIIPLSKARNIALDFIYLNRIIGNYIMFPDDDSTFDASFFDLFLYKIKGNTLINVLNSDKKGYFLKLPFDEQAELISKNYKYACSVNLIIKYETVVSIGYFDEQLGVGSYYGSGEDNDFYIRASKISPFTACSVIYTMHPSRSYKIRNLSLPDLIKRYKNYGVGVVYMLCKNHFTKNAIILCLKAPCASIMYLFLLQFKLSIAYLYSFYSRIQVLITYFLMKQKNNRKIES